MKSHATVLGLLASVAVAQPFGHAHAHRHLNQRRDIVTEWETVITYETVTEIIDETTTEFIYPSHTSTSTTSTPTTMSTVSMSTAISASPQVPGQFFEGASSSSLSSSTPVAAPSTPSTPAAYVAPTTSVEPAPAAPSTTSTSEEAVYTAVAAPTTSTPVAQVQTAVASAAAVATASSSSSSGGSSSGTTYSGDLTYYTVGLGSCGVDDSGLDMTTNIVAIAADLMGSQSNGNPMCGKTVTLSRNGKTATAIVHDKCPGCKGQAIDGSQALFLALFDGSLDQGRGTVKWWFND